MNIQYKLLHKSYPRTYCFLYMPTNKNIYVMLMHHQTINTWPLAYVCIDQDEDGYTYEKQACIHTQSHQPMQILVMDMHVHSHANNISVLCSYARAIVHSHTHMCIHVCKYTSVWMWAQLKAKEKRLMHAFMYMPTSFATPFHPLLPCWHVAHLPTTSPHAWCNYMHICLQPTWPYSQSLKRREIVKHAST